MVGGWVVAHVIIVSAQSKELDFGPVGTGEWGLGLGLDKNVQKDIKI